MGRSVVTLVMEAVENMLAKRGLNDGGAVQRYVDEAVLRYAEPYIPVRSGQLKESGYRATQAGSGRVIWQTPYAARMYYGVGYTFAGAPMRGAYWFERMKADKGPEIVDGARRMAQSSGDKYFLTE